MAPDAPAWLVNADIYSVRGADGFRCIRGALSPSQQLELAERALCEWAEPPNDSNLALHHPADERRGLWARRTREDRDSLLPRLSWVTLGYHYQWTERTYDPGRRSPFPPSLAALASDIAAACGDPMVGEAAIVNFYGPRSTMGGHQDDAEPHQAAPIVSISVGLEAVYLLGGPTKDVEPLAMRLRSGDVVVQGGASRGCYHGVPLVIADSAPRAQLLAAASSAGRGAVAEWLLDHRINVNVRQVYAQPRERSGEGAAPDEPPADVSG